MTSEPDSLVLHLLREIRATQEEHKKILDSHSRYHQEHSQAFAEIRDELRSVKDTAVYAAGFSLLGRRETDLTGARVVALEERVKRLEERVGQ